MSTEPSSVNPHPVNRPLLTRTHDDLLNGLIALRRERTIASWRLRAAGIAPLADLERERQRREFARPSDRRIAS
jgi:hypothetical protein